MTTSHFYHRSMKHVDPVRQPEHLRRTSRDGFRSRELLTSLTLSAEAITLSTDSGSVELAAARAAGRRISRVSPQKRSSLVENNAVQDVVSLSKAKILTMKRLQSIRKYRIGLHDSFDEGDDEDENSTTIDFPVKAKRRSVLPMAAVALLTSKGESSSQDRSSSVEVTQEKHAIGQFETRDSRWNATIDGEVEKFMYPSLRLERLYDDPLSNNNNDHDHTKEIPSTKTIDEALANTSKISWKLEHLPRTPEPLLVTEQQDSKRLQFDQKLMDAEAVLQKKEVGSLRPKAAPPVLEHRADTKKLISVESESATTLETRQYEAESPQQQPIPRLPQARKFIKEIQRHTTNAGQIEYYADKQHLFEKWKKVQVSQQHHQPSSSALRELLQFSGDEFEDVEHQGCETLSPRSLFYQECEKSNILPEPIFSRINEVVAPASQPSTARKSIPEASSFAAVASILMEKMQNNGVRVGRKKRHLALQLQQFGLGDAKIIALSTSLRQFQAIQVLDLSDNRLTDASIIPLLQSLAEARSPLPESKRRSQSQTENQSAKAKLIAAVNRTRNSQTSGCILTVLNLSKNELGREGCRQIAHFLGSCNTLTYLDLSNTTLGGDDEAFAPVATAIECHLSLKRVNLAHNSIGERGGVLLGDMLTKATCVVRALDVSWNNIRRSGAVALGMAMRTNTALRTLHMSMNRCGDGGGEQLAAALACNTTLKHLDLSHNALTGASAVAFGFFLRQNSSLQALDMKDNSLGEVGARALMRAIAAGSRCEIMLSVHDLETSAVGSTPAASSPIFDASLPSASSPFELRIGESPYEFAVASELIEAALTQKRCALSDISFEDSVSRGTSANSTARKRPGSRAKSARNRSRVTLAIDPERRCLYNIADPSKVPWNLPTRGTLRTAATFTPPPLPRAPLPWLSKESCLGLIHIVSHTFSTRDMLNLLDLVLADLQLTTSQATFFVTQLQGSLPKLELIGRLWPCLIDGENVFDFLQQHLTQSEQWRLVDRFGPAIVQFSTANPTGHWSLVLRDSRQRKIALWFASLNSYFASIMARYHTKRTDCSQYGHGFFWRNVHFNQKPIQLTYAFFDRLPREGLLEFDFVSPLRPEDRSLEIDQDTNVQENTDVDESPVQSLQTPITDQDLAALLAQVGAEVCAIYVPVHKRQNLKYQLVLFHIAIAGRRVVTRQAHYILQHFPKNYESGRLRALVAMHHAIIDLECFGELLERLALTDRPRVYTSLGYLNTVMPLAVDMDFEVDFTREDEKMLLRALVDLSISCPMDMIRIDSSRSTVLIIYSMYQTNTVPATGRICFRYVTHQPANRLEWLRARQQIYRHFLCGNRLKALSDSASLALATSASSNESTNATAPAGNPEVQQAPVLT